MKTITLLSLAGVAFLSVAQPTWAGPRGGGGGGHFGGGGRVGGFAGGGSRAAPAFHGGGFQGAPAFRGAYFSGRSVGRPSVAPRFYYGRSGMPAVRSRGFAAVGNRSLPSTGDRISTIRQSRTGSFTRQNTRVPNSQVNRFNQQPNRAGSIAGRNRVSNPRTAPANRQSFVRNHASERHNANDWHRDWNRHHSHFHNHKVFVFVNGFWWGLNPWDYYGAGYPYDYYGDYPYDSSGYPYDYDYSSSPYDYGYYNYYPYSDDEQPDYGGSGPSSANATVSAVQSELARRGYYNGAIDGDLGDQTEAALARYQQDRDLSVTGTVDAATLQSLGIK